MTFYAEKVLPNKLFQAGMALLFFGYIALSIYGGMNLKKGLPERDLANDVHYVKAYVSRYEEAFELDQNPLAYLYYRNID